MSRYASKNRTAKNHGSSLRSNRPDKSARNLLISNGLIIAIAVIEGWRLSDVMLIYWGQSVIIGWFNFWRILALRNFSTKGFKINNRSVKPTTKTRKDTAIFFLLHYGFFHLVYFLFLASLFSETEMSRGDLYSILLCIVIFLINHWYSYRYNLEQDLKGKPNIGTIMFFPYARIIPMHLTIIAGGMLMNKSIIGLVLFLLLKTGADFIMHAVEHNMYGKGNKLGE